MTLTWISLERGTGNSGWGMIMSVILFIDESGFLQPDTRERLTTRAGVAFTEARYEDFCRGLYRLQHRFFRRSDRRNVALQGRLLLNHRARDSFRKAEFTLEIFSLARLSAAQLFSVTSRQTLAAARRTTDLPKHDGHPDQLENHPNRTEVDLRLAHLLERVNSFMLENHPSQKAKIVFPTEDAKRDRRQAETILNLFYRTPYGTGFSGILGAPFFAPASLSPGLQVADLSAYIINQQHRGRRDLQDFFAEAESLQYVSSLSQEEYEIKGMMVLE